MNDKIIPFRRKTKFQKIKKNFDEEYLPRIKIIFKKIIEAKKMLFLVIIVGCVVGSLVWSYFIENVARADVIIPQSRNITYNNEIAKAIRADNLNDEFEDIGTSPVLLYIYTSWCSTCRLSLIHI